MKNIRGGFLKMADALDVISKILAGVIMVVGSPVILPVLIGMTINESETEEKARKQEVATNATIPTIVVFGNTGSGKSSLLNYLFSTKFITGDGRPITEGLNEQKLDIAGKKIKVVDTEGLEVGKDNVWQAMITQTQFMYQNLKCVLYCINASQKRITAFDIKTIKQLTMSPKKTKVIIVLTKTDITTERDTQILKSVLKNADIGCSVVEVCSVNKGASKKFGKEELLKTIF